MANIHPTAIIDPSAELGKDVEIGPYAVIGRECRLGDGCSVGAHAVVGKWTVLGRRCRVFPHACIGEEPQDLKFRGERSFLEAGDENTFREFCTLNRGVGENSRTVVGSNNLFMAYTHVGHDCLLGSHIVISNCASLAGHVTVEDSVTIGGLAGIHQFVRIGQFSMVGGGTSLVKDLMPFVIVTGDDPKVFGLNNVGLNRGGFSREEVKSLDQAYRLLFRSKFNTAQAVEAMAPLAAASPSVAKWVEFIKASQRGIQK